MKDSAVMSTGTSKSLALVDTSSKGLRGFVVGGVFNYLNHTSDSTSFGNIAYYNQPTSSWQAFGGGCNGAVTSIAVIPITSTTNCTLSDPCYSIVVAGKFNACFQVNNRCHVVG